MDHSVLGQVLGGLFDGSGSSGKVGGVLGQMLGDGRAPPDKQPATAQSHDGLLLKLLPLALAWVQRAGGLGAVLQRFEQQGYGAQAHSWVSTSHNQPVDPQAVQKIVGPQEIEAMAQRLGVSNEQVAQAFAEVMPQLVDRLTPAGQLPQQADQWLARGQQVLEGELHKLGQGASVPS
jgi:uncharacterized protein YidB (DUF937 family)